MSHGEIMKQRNKEVIFMSLTSKKEENGYRNGYIRGKTWLNRFGHMKRYMEKEKLPL